MIKNCLICFKEFETNKNAQKCCSKECQEIRKKNKDKNKYANKDLTCIHCNKQFIGNANNKFCSKECKGENRKNNLHSVKSGNCKYCGCEFEAKNYHAKFCSDKCRRNYFYDNNKTKDVCIICENEFESSVKNQKCCSVKCEAKRRSQESRERNGDSFPNQRARVEYKRRQRKIRTKVEEVKLNILIVRDKGICQLCGELVDLRVHYNHHLAPTNDHIVPLALGGETSYDNCQLAHRGCNSRKSHFILFD